MLELLKQKDVLLKQLKHYVETFGLTHSHTVSKSQELDAVIYEIILQNIEIQRRVG